MRLFVLLALPFVMGLGCCKSTKQQANSVGESKPSGALAKIIVYKTKGDYSALVPVNMNAEKTEVVAYPAPTDLASNSKLAMPTALKNGYWLDNRGIGVNSVFLSISYDEYAKLNGAPALSEMMKMIIDKDPLLEVYYLGERGIFKNEVDEINAIITKGKLGDYKRLK